MNTNYVFGDNKDNLFDSYVEDIISNMQICDRKYYDLYISL